MVVSRGEGHIQMCIFAKSTLEAVCVCLGGGGWRRVGLDREAGWSKELKQRNQLGGGLL